jgi:hypothetical protein
MRYRFPGLLVLAGEVEKESGERDDINGRTISKNAPFGKIHWIEMSRGKKTAARKDVVIQCR